MKKSAFFLSLIALSLLSCQKKIEGATETITGKGIAISTERDSYEKYTILKGQQFCDKSNPVPTKYQQLNFMVRFDSSAIYHTVAATNQDDINKLFGFSDNNALHHQYSARFGWRWSNDSLRLFGYTYNNGVMHYKELGPIQIGAENTCSIRVVQNEYVFVLNGEETTMPRESTTNIAEGYKLYPYFGGDETAPHTISIWIREL
jgi:hypothetical protein